MTAQDTLPLSMPPLPSREEIRRRGREAWEQAQLRTGEDGMGAVDALAHGAGRGLVDVGKISVRADQVPGRPGFGGQGGSALAVRDAGAPGLAPAPSWAAVPSMADPHIDGARVLDQAYGWLSHMAWWNNEPLLVTSTLFAAASHMRDPATGMPVFLYVPNLFYTAPGGGTGKSHRGKLVGLLCPNSKALLEPTKAGLIGLIGKRHVVRVTELDILLGPTGRRNGGIVAVINGTYEPGNEHVHKHGGTEVTTDVFEWVILDGLDFLLKLPGDTLRTLFSRCLIGHCEIAPTDWVKPRLDEEMRATAGAISGRMAKWAAQEVRDGIARDVPELPEGLGNRPQDLWEPLLMVADRAGGNWPALARWACKRLEAAGGSAENDAARAAVIDATLARVGAARPPVLAAVAAGDAEDED